MVSLVEMAIQQGTSVLIENLEVSVDPVLAPVVGRQTIRRGRSQYLKLGDKEVSYNPNFRLILQTRLSNPHYPPELQAECTLINFTVTEKVSRRGIPCLIRGYTELGLSDGIDVHPQARSAHK